MATLQKEPTKTEEPVPVAKYEIKNPILSAQLIRKYPDKDVPYPSEDAKGIADKMFKNENRIELENVLFDVDDAQKGGRKEVKIKGDLSDKTHHSLFQMGFRMKMGYEQKPAHMINANTDHVDFNKSWTLITW